MRGGLLWAADYVGTTERGMRRLVTERKVAFHKVNRRLVFDERDLDAYLATVRVEPHTRAGRGGKREW